MRKFLLFFCLLFAFYTKGISQDKYEFIKQRLDSLSKAFPGLKQKVEVNVSDLSMLEFVNAIGISNKINISADKSLDFNINNNFVNVNVIDVLIFISKQYDVDIEIVGSIITLKKHIEEPKPKIILPNKALDIQFNNTTKELSFDLKNDTLFNVLKEITKKTGVNVIAAKDIEGSIVSSFVQNKDVKKAIEMLGLTNNFKLNLEDTSFIKIEKRDATAVGESNPNNNFGQKNIGSKINTKGKSEIIVSGDMVTIDEKDYPIQDLLIDVANKLKLNYYFLGDIKGNTTVKFDNVNYESVFKHVLNNTEYSFKKIDSIYLFGDRLKEGLRETKVIPLKYRTIDKVVELIPAEMKKSIEIKSYTDLNSLIVSGSSQNILEIEKLLLSIDKVVPVVSIEVIVMEVRNSSAVAKGFSMGISDKPTPTTGEIFPGLDMSVGSGSINKMLSWLTGTGAFGNVILGRLMPNFYVKLQLLETNGAIKIKSTPKLATLNGHEASLSIGRTEYYLEIQNNVIGAQNPQNIISQQYKSVNADLSLTINPVISADEQITLDVKIKQSTFTERISPTAPPGTITRDFKSLIRVKNEESVMLGGLEESSDSDSGRGIPGLSRVPVLKWLFSNRNKNRSKSKLLIIIKPTVSM